jgi:hypothetical protein
MVQAPHSEVIDLRPMRGGGSLVMPLNFKIWNVTKIH